MPDNNIGDYSIDTQLHSTNYEEPKKLSVFKQHASGYSCTDFETHLCKVATYTNAKKSLKYTM